MSTSSPNNEKTTPNAPPKTSKKMHWLPKSLLWLLGVLAAGIVAVLLTVAVALSMAYPNLPDVSELADYRPKLPLRVYSQEGALLG